VDTGTTEKSTGTVGIPYGARCMALRVPGNAMEPVGFQNRTSPGRFTGRNAAATTFTGMGLKRILTAIRLTQLNRLTCLKMISSQRHWNSCWIWLWAIAVATPWPTHAALASPPHDDYVLERTVGYQPDMPPRNVLWRAPEPRWTNLIVYSAQIPEFNPDLMRRVAAHFGVKGEIERFDEPLVGAFGYWIRERNWTNRCVTRDVAFIVTTGAFRYGTSDSGNRYDPKTKTHPNYAVPNKTEALERALQLLPLLKVTTNDLQLRADGTLLVGYDENVISYNDRQTRERKRVVIQRGVTFYQRMPAGSALSTVGDGGKLRFSFVSGGEVSGIEWFFRKLTPAGQAKPKSSKQIVKDIKAGRCWTWHQHVPESLTVTNCELAYPQGNSMTHQDYVWPFYMVTGIGPDQRRVTLFVAPNGEHVDLGDVMRPNRAIGKPVLATLVLCSVAMALLLLYNARRVGRVLDSYRGVPVYDNGLLFFWSYGRHYAPDGYYYGQKWQCV